VRGSLYYECFKGDIEYFETVRKNTCKSTAAVQTNDKKLKRPNNIANAFNTFFLTITGKLNTHEVLKVDAFSFYKIYYWKIP
jgi:hypothetical protein